MAELGAAVDEIERLITTRAESWLVLQAKDRYYEILEGAGNAILKEIQRGLLGRVVAARVGFHRRGLAVLGGR